MVTVAGRKGVFSMTLLQQVARALAIKVTVQPTDHEMAMLVAKFNTRVWFRVDEIRKVLEEGKKFGYKTTKNSNRRKV